VAAESIDVDVLVMGFRGATFPGRCVLVVVVVVEWWFWVWESWEMVLQDLGMGNVNERV
jgi:hypothetical protein